MSKPRRKRVTKSNDSVDESKKGDVNNTANQLNENPPTIHAEEVMSDEIKGQNQITSDTKGIEGGEVSSDKTQELLNLQTKYRELSDKIKAIDDKITTISSMNTVDKAGYIEKPNEMIKSVESLRKDLGPLILYGKLFFGIGAAALLLYIINSVITLISLTAKTG
jgi:hypothetical protein